MVNKSGLNSLSPIMFIISDALLVSSLILLIFKQKHLPWQAACKPSSVSPSRFHIHATKCGAHSDGSVLLERRCSELPKKKEPLILLIAPRRLQRSVMGPDSSWTPLCFSPTIAAHLESAFRSRVYKASKAIFFLGNCSSLKMMW